MPRFGTAAASTALPQPPRTSHAVPKNSATGLRAIAIASSPRIAVRLLLLGTAGLRPAAGGNARDPRLIWGRLSADPGEIVLVAARDRQNEKTGHGVGMERPCRGDGAVGKL